jgi:hypothetical protein
MRSATLAAILVSAILIGCSGPAPTVVGSPSVASTATPTTRSAGTTTTPVALATPAATCHLTRVDPALVPPSPYPARPPASSGSSWFGSRALWTMLRPEGEVWRDLPRDKVGYGQKTVWWSADWDAIHEPEPAIRVTGRQLDGPATLSDGDPGTSATADGYPTAMMVGVVLPAPGCWELTARYRAAALSIVVWVAGD